MGDFSGWVDGKRFDLGDIPLRIGGIKNYDTGDDEVILEAPLLWGSSAQVSKAYWFRPALVDSLHQLSLTSLSHLIHLTTPICVFNQFIVTFDSSHGSHSCF